MIRSISTILLAIFNRVLNIIYRLFSRLSRYALTAIILNLIVWSLAFVTISLLPERYESKWTLILPGAGIGGRIDIDNIGSASAIVESGFSSRNLNPKISYKSIAQSSKVIQRAAKSVDMSVKSFGKPHIKLVDQTSLIFFTMNSDTAEIAQKKSWALYQALQTEIDHLRLDEIRHREQGIQTILKSVSQKLNQAKNNLLSYQAQSNIVTIEQFNRIPLLIEDMRIEQLKLNAQKEQAYEEMMALHRILGLTSKQASQLLSLQADPLFNKLLESQSKASVTLSEHKNQFGSGHHKVKQYQLTYESTSAAIKARTEALIGKQQHWLEKTALAENSKRNALLHELINKKVTYEGFKHKAFQLDQQITAYGKRLQTQTHNVSKLDELEREHQIAEAVFTSTVAKIDTGKSDIFASYPMLQLFMEPTLPEKISGARPWHIYLGGFFGSALSILILIILWIRRLNIDNSIQNV